MVQAITKAFTGMFGQKVGGFLARIVNAPFNFLLNSFYYIQQGDFKGLIKYWGKVALQVALVVFVAVIAPYLLGVLFGFLGAILSGIGSLLGAIGGFLANTVPLLGQVLGGVLKGASFLLNHAGQFLSRVGTKLITQSKEIFQNLKDQGLKGIFKQFKEKLLDQINPLRNLKIGTEGRIDGIRIPGACPGLSFVSCGGEGGSLLSQLIDPLKQKLGERLAKSGIMETSFMKTLVKIGNAISLQFLKDKIDKKLEGSKMNEFLKGLIRTVSHAGIDAISNGAMALATVATAGAAGPLAALGKVGAVLGKVGAVLGKVGQAVKAVAGTVFNAVKATGSFLWNATKTIGSAIGRGLQFIGSKIGNAFNATKSFFSNISQKIFGTRNAPINANQITRYSQSGAFSLGDDFAKITFGPDAFKFEKIPTALAHGANGLPTELLHGNSRFILNPVSEKIFRADLDAGDLAFVKPDSRFDALTQIEQIGNLPSIPTPERPLDFRTLALDLLTKGPAGIGERIGRSPQVREAVRVTKDIIKPNWEDPASIGANFWMNIYQDPPDVKISGTFVHTTLSYSPITRKREVSLTSTLFGAGVDVSSRRANGAEVGIGPSRYLGVGTVFENGRPSSYELHLGVSWPEGQLFYAEAPFPEIEWRRRSQ